MRPLDNNTEPHSSVGDKFKPSVGGGGKNGKYLAIAFLAILSIILLHGYFSKPEQSAKVVETSLQVADTAAIPVNLEMSAGQYAASFPVLPMKKIPPPPPSVLPSQQVSELLQNNQVDETRIKSPSLVYSANQTSAADNAHREGSADSNTSFLDQASNAPVVTMKAKLAVDMSYKILQGKLIQAVLETAINSDLPGMVRAVVSHDIYGDNGKLILLPRGTRLVGQYNSGVSVGQTRVMIAWTRAITPNHIDISLGSPGTDSLGQSGMQGPVDTHFWKIFGTSALLSVLGVAGSSVNTGNTGEMGVAGNPYQTAVIQGVVNTSNNVLQSRMTIQPTLHIQQGSVIQVFVARDLDFSNLGNHQNPYR